MEFHELVKQYGFINAGLIVLAGSLVSLALYLFKKIKTADTLQEASLSKQLNEFPEAMKKNNEKLDVVIAQLGTLANLVTQLISGHQELKLMIDNLNRRSKSE